MDKLHPNWLKLRPLRLKQLNKTLVFYCLVVLGSVALPTKAQIIPDNTLGIESSSLRTVILNDLPSTQIEGGALRDSLLFHSFQEFNIDEGYGAYFFNPDDISTIFSRVTGSNPSNLLGTLGVLGNADLVFLNPNGVLFGPNSQLDIEGSLTTTTANEIVFPNGEVFSAGTPGVPSLIENNLVAPIGLMFEGQTLAPIVSQGNLSTGGNLTLAAHKISTEGGELSAGNDLTLQADDAVQIRDGVDEAFVAIAGNRLTITGQNQVDIFALNHPQSVLTSGGDMTLQSASPVIGDAHFVASGSFRIEDLTGELGPLVSEVDPIIASANDVMLEDYTGASLHILAGGRVMTGNITITGVDAAATSIGPNAPAPFNEPVFREIVLSDGETTISIDGGAQPTLDIRAGIDWETLLGSVPDDINLLTGVNPNPVFGTTATSADITIGGNVNISAPDGLVYLSNQYFPNTNLSGGDIEINDIITESPIGRGGNIAIDSRNDLTAFGSVRSTALFEDAGDISVLARNAISFLSNESENILDSSNLVFGRGGDIDIITGTLLIQNGFDVNSSSIGLGDAGNITIQARESVSIEGILIADSFNQGNSGFISLIATEGDVAINQGGIFSNVVGTGNSGGIEILAKSLQVSNESFLDTSIRSLDSPRIVGQGNAGLIKINVRDDAFFETNSTVFSLVGLDASGEGNNIEITANSLVLNSGAAIIAGTIGEGDSGDIIINVGEALSLDGIGTDGGASSINTSIFPGAEGQGGNIILLAPSLSIANGAQVIASNVLGTGDAGDINFTGDSLNLTNGGSISTFTAGEGDSGNINIDIEEDINISGFITIPERGVSINSGIATTVSAGALGNAGTISLQVRSLSMLSDNFISSDTFSNGNAGDIIIQADNSIVVNQSIISSGVAPGGQGEGGEIGIQGEMLKLTNGGQITAGLTRERQDIPSGQGEGGEIRIAITDTITIAGFNPGSQFLDPFNPGETVQVEGFPSGIISSTERGAVGPAGDIWIDTGSLFIKDGAVVTAATFNNSNAGDIFVSADNFTATGGGQILTSTFEGGIAGEIRVIVTDEIHLSGDDSTFASRLTQFGDDIVGRVDSESGIFSNTANESTGNGGDIIVSAMSLSIDDGALLSVASLGEGDAGDINVNDTWVVQLDHQSGILSQSTSGNGGDINFRNVDLLTLRENSTVSTEAGLNSVGGGGNGGNINADIDFIFAVPSENSDIIANAFDGTGGNIFIVTEGISGLEFRPELTQFSDITASSEFGVDGTVTIDTPGIDFARGFNPLPDALRGTDITDSCDVSDNQDTVELFDIGQGGSIASPEDPLATDDFIDANWISLTPLTDEITRNPNVAARPTGMQSEPDITVTSSAALPGQLITMCQQASHSTK